MTAIRDPRVSAPTAARPVRVPRRVLLVTGNLGGGHHAAARAVEEQVRRAWPGVEVVWTETLAAMGSGASRLFPAVYAGCVRRLPWLYGFYYRLLRVPLFRGGTRAVVGAWSAPGLRRAVELHEPDLVVATFPEGIQGLARLRRRGHLPMAVVALVADPAPHPLWLATSLDLHLVSTVEGRALAHEIAPTARVQVGAWPVVAAFRPPDHPGRRARPLVYVSGGTLGFGDLGGACAAVLAGGGDVVVSCGRDPGMRARLQRLADAHRGRVDVRTWIDDPATVLRDCDAVVTNAGGATALEAIACACPLLLYAPVAGHGRANAEVLVCAGLARVCASPAELSAAVAGPLASPAPPSPPEVDTAALGRLTATRAGPRVRPQDALFLHVAGPPQQIGACVVVDDPERRGGWREHVVSRVRSRAPDIDLLCRRLAPPRSGRPLRWCYDPAPDAERHVRPDVLPTGNLDEAVTAFLAEPLNLLIASWRLQLVRDGDRLAVLAKAHHALGDGIALTDALARLLADDPGPPPTAMIARTGARGARAHLAHHIRRSWPVARGMLSLARAGFAPPSTLGPVEGRPRWVSARLDGRQVRAAARRHGVGTAAVVLAVVAEAVSAVVPVGRLRTMTPVTTRTRARVGSRAAGNRTAALPLDLPLEPMAAAERVREIAEALDAAARSRRAEGAAAVLAGLGLLPRCVQVRWAALVYGPRFFHAIASVLPGMRRGMHLRGAPVTEVYPVLPLADGVGLGVGAMHWGATTTTVGITCRSPELAARLPTLLPLALADILGR